MMPDCPSLSYVLPEVDPATVGARERSKKAVRKYGLLDANPMEVIELPPKRTP